jgi:nucleoside-diphosphate-sugar epimerase
MVYEISVKMIEIASSSEKTKMHDLANMVNRLTGQTLRKFNQQTFRKSLTKNASASYAEAGIKYVERRDWDVKTRLLSSIEKAKKLLDYEPQMEFEDGLKRVHEWFVENWENIEKNAEF